MHTAALLSAVLALVAAAAFTRPTPTPQPNKADPFPLSPKPFLKFTPTTFTITDTEPATFSLQLLANPGGVKPVVFLQGDGLSFDKCRVEYSSGNWNKDQAVKAYPTVSFKSGTTKSFVGTLLAWQGNPAHGKTQSIEYTRKVSAGRTCQATGDPHYISFDDKKFTYMGKKIYYLFKSSTLVVMTRHGDYYKNKDAAVIIGVAIIYGPTVYVVDGLNKHEKDRLVLLSKNSDGVTVDHDDKLKHVEFKMSDGARVKLSLDKPGDKDLQTDVHVIVPACYKGKTAGMCGPYDDNKKNDLMKPNGKQAKDIDDFGDSWKVEDADDVFDKGDKAAIIKTLQAQPKTVECAFPKDLKGVGVAPPPPGYQTAVVKQTPPTTYKVTPAPVVTVVKGRKDPAFAAFARKICTDAITMPGLNAIAGMPKIASYINDCVMDCELGGDLGPVDNHRQAYQQAAYTFASAGLANFKICEKTGKPRPRTPAELVAEEKKLGLNLFKCPGAGAAQCGGKGSCKPFGCACNTGFSKTDCSMNLNAQKIPAA